MSRWGSCDFKELEGLSERMEQLADEERVIRFIEEASKELASRLLTLSIKRTPVGIYPVSSGKTGGTLKNAWIAKGAGKTPSSAEIKEYVNSLAIAREGGFYTIAITNPVDYASYVEYGHRTANHKGWVEGQFMMTISEKEINTIAPRLLEKRLNQLLKEVFQ